MVSMQAVLRALKSKLTKSTNRSHEIKTSVEKEKGIFFDSINQDKVGANVQKKIIKGQKKFLADLRNFINLFMEGLYWSERTGRGLLKLPPSATNYRQTIYNTRRTRVGLTQSAIIAHNITRNKVSGEYYTSPQQIAAKEQKSQEAKQINQEKTNAEKQHHEKIANKEQRIGYINNRIRAMGIDPNAPISDAPVASSPEKAYQRATFLELKRRQMYLENTNER